MTRVVAVGGSDAGIAAALRALECDPAADVTVVVADSYPNYSICGLPFYLSGETPDWHDLAHRTRADLADAGIRLLLDHRAHHVDSTARQVAVVGPDGDAVLDYDQLVVATGAHPVRPRLPGLDLPGVHVLHTMADSFALGEDLAAARTAVIIGAGYIGTEMADALTYRGLGVTLIGRAPTVLSTVDPQLGEVVAAELRAHGVDVVTSATAGRIAPGRRGLTVTGSVGTAGSLTRTADVVLVAVGVRPDTALAQAAGARLGHAGALAVDRGMRTSVDGVLAAGDCVHTWHRLLRRHTYLPLGTTSHKQGRVAGENAVGGGRAFAGSVGTQVVKAFDLAVARTGLRDHEAREAGLDPVTVESTLDDHKAYYPGAVRLRVRVTGDRRTGRLLGAQVVGPAARGQVAKRVDAYAAALHWGATVDDVSDLDLSYTPPFASPWDAVQAAAQAWSRRARAGGPASAG